MSDPRDPQTPAGAETPPGTGHGLPPGAPNEPPPRAGLVHEPAEISEEELRRRTRRAFLLGGAATLAGALGWRWIRGAEKVGLVPRPIREGLKANEALWQHLNRPGALAPTFPLTAGREPRTNGYVGLRTPLDAAAWRLQVQGPDFKRIGQYTLDDIRRLPRVEFATELKCVEGWSVVVRWAGARFSDFAALAAGAVPDNAFRYVSLRTPDDAYYVALHRAQAMHPQTILCYEMQGRPLPPEHGAPLRLVIPTAYGVKNLKRIGTIRFATERPRDYWAEYGYDYYLGH